MEGKLTGPGWRVPRHARKFRHAIEMRNSNFVAGYDHEKTAMSNVAFCVWLRLNRAIIESTAVSHRSDDRSGRQDLMINFR